jgi:hypothetical protein
MLEMVRKKEGESKCGKCSESDVIRIPRALYYCKNHAADTVCSRHARVPFLTEACESADAQPLRRALSVSGSKGRWGWITERQRMRQRATFKDAL